MRAIASGARALRDNRLTRLLVSLAAAAALTVVPVQAVTGSATLDEHADGPHETCSEGCDARGFKTVCCNDPIG